MQTGTGTEESANLEDIKHANGGERYEASDSSDDYEAAMSTYAAALVSEERHSRRAIMSGSLTTSGDHDLHQIVASRAGPQCVRQTVAFLDLSAELRNRIYE
ncbi:hypothetical protein BAUCODRAFT_229335 [Baudoinia panamericana UAMH 10762]|uniref:Uncharacterized protein n=1 Tax=Baudoinia panamericana (strain UAMH 10762) TaxID=717646 RepID=M2N2E0_BAUPA|nr:uncharacterized protein BAUCODRAFT_229335 [Baudoinia panamericana UAMH 10762]EMC93149.1 hypothetical protein BAUCODRAFT_229335 [Baudoinia panamericana UAMH 10762]